MGSVPSTFTTGYKYVGMGYTTAFDAAILRLARAMLMKNSKTPHASTRGSTS